MINKNEIYVVYLEQYDSVGNIERIEFQYAFHDRDKADKYCDELNEGSGGSYRYYVQYVEIKE